MYNLVRFLLHYWLFIFFLLLEGLCAYLIYQNSRFHQALMFNQANEINGVAYQAYSNSVEYLRLGKVNDSLAKENAELRARVAESFYSLKKEEISVTDSTAHPLQVFSYMPAKVVKNSVNQAANYLYLNKGKRLGITPQMGVITANGIVGQVVSVTENYSAVMSVLNKNFRISAKLKKSKFFGQLLWEGKNARIVHLSEIPKHVPVKMGDTVVTSGYSVLFPENIMIGRVKKVDAKPENNFQEIDVELSADMNNLDYVYVVNHMQRQEIQQLDSATLIQPKK